VIGDTRGPETPAHHPLLDWLAASGYQVAVVPLLLPEAEALPLNCQRCTWNRRRTLFEAAERLGCHVVALGHHADDLAQTTLLNLLVGGRAETMAPRREYFGGRLRLVRPLCYVAESELHRFARACDFPPPPEVCPRSDHSRRRLAAGLMRQARQGLGRDVRTNLLRAGLRGNEDDRRGQVKEKRP
jgi:tRNA(Ile)-lysidine synthase TilS/MesJ